MALSGIKVVVIIVRCHGFFLSIRTSGWIINEEVVGIITPLNRSFIMSFNADRNYIGFYYLF